MTKETKVVKFGKEARAKLKTGIDVVGDAVAATLGHAGRNAIVGRKYRTPQFSNDGLFIANQIVLEDEVENLGAQALIEVAQRQNDAVGDGTSTAVTLAQKLIATGFDRLDSGKSLAGNADNAMQIFRDIMKAKDDVLHELEKETRLVQTREDLVRVATVSLESPEYGEIVGGMIHELGPDGFVYVEEGFSPNIEHDVVKGMQIRASYLSPFMATNDRKQAILEGVPVIVTNQEIHNPYDLKPLVEMLGNANPPQRTVVVIAPRFGKELPGTLYSTKTKGNFNILAIAAPALTNEELEDVAHFVGCRFLDEKMDVGIRDVRPDDFGKVAKIISTTEDTVLSGGYGSDVLLKARVQKLREHMEIAETDIEKKILNRRIGSLTSGIGVIRVGAKTEAERGYWKHKFDDAVPATKAALEQGVVRGAGITLKEIAERLPKNILTEALKAPYEQIKENAGCELEVSADIIDPVKVTKMAVEHACSIAGLLLTTEIAIVEKNEDVGTKLAELLQR